jgi:hypothetical protein
MVRNAGFYLSGKTTTNFTKLHSQHNNSCDIPVEVQQLKILIMNAIILPFMSKNWIKLEENLWLLDKINVKINLYSVLYTSDYLSLYKDVLTAVETAIFQHMEIENLEKQLYGSCGTDASTIIFKTPFMRLKAEYELYNLILGKPNALNNETYNDNIINDIIKLINLNEISFNKIKNFIIKKYK